MTALLEGHAPGAGRGTGACGQGGIRNAAARRDRATTIGGWRLLLAVLDKRAELSFAALDVFLNVVGGVRMQEPGRRSRGGARRSPRACSIDRSRADAVFIGEVGLGGEVRPVSQIERRLAEAAKMGMRVAYVAERGAPKRRPSALQVEGVANLHALFARLFL